MSMDDLSVGGKQFLEAMMSLQDVSAKVNEGSVDMEVASGKVSAAIDTVRRVSFEVADSAVEITAGIKEISSAMLMLSELAESLGEITDLLETEANEFKTD